MIYDHLDAVVNHPDFAELLADWVDVHDAEELIQALASKHKLVVGVVDRSWIGQRVDEQLRKHYAWPVSEGQIWSLTDTLVDEASRRIFEKYGNQSNHEVLDKSALDDMEGIIAGCMKPLWPLSMRGPYTFALELLNGDDVLLSITGLKSFDAAYLWGEQSVGQDADDVLTDNGLDGAIIKSLGSRGSAFDRVDSFRIIATEYGTGEDQVLSVRQH